MFQARTLDGAHRDGVSDHLPGRRLSWTAIRRNKGLVLFGLLAALALGVIYLAWRPEAYTASSRILVDNRVLSLQQQDAIYSVSSLTSQMMDSQVEILRSEAIAHRVIDELKLLNDPDFHPMDRGNAAAAAETPLTLSRDLRRALNIFQKRLSVDRLGQSYVIEIRMTVSDPQRAAEITNSLVSAYLDDQSKANESIAQAASGWLRSRLQSLGTTARVLTKATAPIERDGPRAAIILGFAAFCGLSLGAGLAFARDGFDRKLRTRDAVQTASQAECFGILPIIEGPRMSFFGRRRERLQSAQAPITKTVVAKASTLDWAMERPWSLFANSLRRVRAALFAGRNSVPIALGVTSALPGEGKTVVAANIARLAAQWGKKVLLIDAVPYNAQLTKLLAPQAAGGLPDLLRGGSFAQFVLCDRWTEMHFLPGMTQNTGPLKADTISSAMERFLAQVKSHYDLVVIDLPPLGPVSDVHELADLLDKILLVVEWGRCTDEELAAALDDSAGIRRKLIGTVLNKADLRKVRQYGEAADGFAGRNYGGYIDDERRVHSSISTLPSVRSDPPGANSFEAAGANFRPSQGLKDGNALSDLGAKKNA